MVLALMLIASSSLNAAQEHSVTVAGVRRAFLVHAPRALRAPKSPLVVLLHGGGGNGEQAMNSYRMNEVADREGFLVAYPDGSGRGERLLTWNAGNCCGYAMRQRVDDVAFIRAMVEEIDRRFHVDRARIFVTGMSNGGMMAHRLGCEASDLFAAIGVVSGALNIPCRPSDEVAAMIIHGTADEHVPYEGGTGSKSFEDRVDLSVAHAVKTWRAIDGCKDASTAKTKGTITTESWSSCHDKTGVTLVKIEGGGHAWPGGKAPRRQFADPTTQEMSASEELWNFFVAHPKRGRLPASFSKNSNRRSM
jgi:polyhydroxybutyrate depolymerase